jgi:ATP-dependent DNA helicase RecG
MTQFNEKESNTLEFKEKCPSIPKLIKEVVAFCNSFGGRILIGIADNGEVIGVTEAEAHELLEHLPQNIFQEVHPQILPKIHTTHFDDKVLVAIQISEGMNKPYFQKSKGLENGTFVRVGRSSMIANGAMIRDLEWRNKGRTPDEKPVAGSTISDFDQKSFLTFRKDTRKVSASQDITLQAKSYKLLSDELGEFIPTVAGILLFGNRPSDFFEEAYIVCSQFTGNEGRQATKSLDCKGTLQQQLELAYSFVIAALPKSFQIINKKRIEKLQIPEIAVREALLNAIVHRDYTIAAPSKIAIYENRLEIFSPGGFPGPLSTLSLEEGITYVRNTFICKVFREQGYIEKLGSGFREIFREYRLNNLSTPIVTEGENFVKVILPRTRQVHLEDPETRDSMELLQQIAAMGSAKASDLMQNSRMSKSTLGRQLATLVKEKRLKRVGSGPATRYFLN